MNFTTCIKLIVFFIKYTSFFSMTGQHEKYEKRVNCVVFYFFLKRNSGIADNPKSPLIVLLEDLSNAGKSGETTEVRYDRRQSWQKLLRTMREDKKT